MEDRCVRSIKSAALLMAEGRLAISDWVSVRLRHSNLHCSRPITSSHPIEKLMILLLKLVKFC